MAVGYWQFDDFTNLGTDRSGLSNTITAACSTPTYNSAGKFGGALYLNGNSTMSILSGAFPIGAPTDANPYTIAVWKKADTGGLNSGGFVGRGANINGEANGLRLNGANSVDDYWWGNDFIVSGLATNPMDGNWHTIVVTWDGTNGLPRVPEAVARRGPIDESPSAFTAHDGAELTVLARDGDWLQVSGASRQRGWFPQKDIALMPGRRP